MKEIFVAEWVVQFQTIPDCMKQEQTNWEYKFWLNNTSKTKKGWLNILCLIMVHLYSWETVHFNGIYYKITHRWPYWWHWCQQWCYKSSNDYSSLSIPTVAIMVNSLSKQGSTVRQQMLCLATAVYNHMIGRVCILFAVHLTDSVCDQGYGE